MTQDMSYPTTCGLIVFKIYLLVLVLVFRLLVWSFTKAKRRYYKDDIKYSLFNHLKIDGIQNLHTTVGLSVVGMVCYKSNNNDIIKDDTRYILSNHLKIDGIQNPHTRVGFIYLHL